MAYKYVRDPTHPNAQANGNVYEHVFVMSEMLGRALTVLEVVHHRDENKGNNLPSNLQLFATQAEHNKHHAKERAFKASGNADFRKCKYCKEYDDISNMIILKGKYINYLHKECRDTDTAKRSATPEGKAKYATASAKYRAKRKLSQQSIGI